jgi:LAS superfamily LD-carboxypeptidase LdcB
MWSIGVSVPRVLTLAAVLCLAVAPARAGKAVGYVAGEKTAIKLTDINGKDVELRTAKAFRVMSKAARKHGVDLRIRSGFRTFQKQATLYKQYRRGQGNLAAPPGYSNHESGRALDLYVTDHKAFDWLQEHGATYGFHRTVPGEAWHWEYLGDEDKQALARPERSSAHGRKGKSKKPKQLS